MWILRGIFAGLLWAILMTTTGGTVDLSHDAAILSLAIVIAGAIAHSEKGD